MLDLVALGNNFSNRRLTADCAGDRFLRCTIIEVLNFPVVCGLPVDEDADADEEIVGLILGNDSLGHAVGNRHGNRVLSGTEHLHGLLGALDRHLVEQYSRGFAQQVWPDYREQCA